MKRKFIKMHGLGNDYIYFNCFEDEFFDAGSWAEKLSDRNIGIGGDGVVLIERSKAADAKMVMFNSDGSRGAMCGNAIRCVGRFLFDEGLVKNVMRIETDSGIKDLTVMGENIRVDMGKPITYKNAKLGYQDELTIDGKCFLYTRISMGNPHAVVFAEDVGKVDLKGIGPKFEHHKAFMPDRVNTEFVQIIDRTHIRMRVWERGSGETKACGTGACASVVAAALLGKCGMGIDVKVSLDGGDLIINYTGDTVFMTGPAIKVFEGEIELK